MNDHLAQAWVESPLQLLGAVEAFAAGLLGPRAHIAAYRKVPTMSTTADAVARLGLPAGLTLGLAGPAQVFRPVRGGAWAVGDVYSWPAQVRMLAEPLLEAVLLDDGLATARAVGKLVAPGGSPLIRDHEAQPRWRRALGAAASRRLRRLAGQGRVAVFTALPPPDGEAAAWRRQGGRLVQHGFEWLRGTPSDTLVAQPTVILGSALVPDGLIRDDAYYRWVADVAAHHGPAAYFPHRREDRAELAVRLPPGMQLVDVGVPVEIALRALGPDHTVFGLVSTALTTLGVVLGGTGTSIRSTPVAPEWWTARATPRFRTMASPEGTPRLAVEKNQRDINREAGADPA
ncbi:MAG: hypothetical protein LBJ08_01775 [Bifidobacteriaceae bacterium]|nr:hypothetical protein [Bifidobacteriaceae bacterium]